VPTAGAGAPSIVALPSAGLLMNAWRRFDKPAACDLTPGEWEVMSGLAMGRTVEQVARVCGKTPSTVRQQVLSARRRLGVNTRAEAILRVRQGWHRPTPLGRREPPLSGVLKAYLVAFDRMLAEWRDARVVERARLEMTHLLAAEMARTGITLARDQRQAPRALKQELPRDLLPGCLAVAA